MKIDGLNWYCLVCVPQKEFITERILRQIGIAPSVFVPSEVKYPRINRKRVRHSKSGSGKRYPLFGSRYVFVGFEGQIPTHHLRRIHLITGVVLERQGAHFRPAEFPPQDIQNVVDLCESFHRGIITVRESTPNPHKSFQAGDHVDVISGAFTGYHLKIRAVRGHFAQFVLDIFGKRQLLEMPLTSLESSL